MTKLKKCLYCVDTVKTASLRLNMQQLLLCVSREHSCTRPAASTIATMGISATGIDQSTLKSKLPIQRPMACPFLARSWYAKCDFRVSHSHHGEAFCSPTKAFLSGSRHLTSLDKRDRIASAGAANPSPIVASIGSGDHSTIGKEARRP